MSNRIAVIDFETTGMAPGDGARATELGLVLLEGGRVVERFQSLMRTGAWVSPFITRLTGITQTMVDAAPPAAEVMREAARLVQGVPMVAHNAAFDRKFWQHELALAGLAAPQPFVCTVLLARRLYPQAASHSLGHLATHLQLPATGRAHRALADAEMAAALLTRMQHDLRARWGVAQPDFGMLQQLQRLARPAVPRWLARQAAGGGAGAGADEAADTAAKIGKIRT
ncbi:PolC-type DNA polymerase III [Extensimonas sp. H3M7-6]|uniref:3'-5' exonuclease n=1 Tax=Extensimonas soli TaxID=3031322 RepID=UPI0023DB6C5A|nr:exonuclease domain-containing protein [Extensimonas sp. H3M7-6]MDF1480624.1 exonuclease domain-containing protein [Extensimonas sp. H3M7-6]